MADNFLVKYGIDSLAILLRCIDTLQQQSCQEIQWLRLTPNMLRVRLPIVADVITIFAKILQMWDKF